MLGNDHVPCKPLFEVFGVHSKPQKVGNLLKDK